MKSVFLSSGVKGLEEYREQVYRAIEGLDGCHCIRMEDFGARDSLSDDFCAEKVGESEIFVALVGHRYGSCIAGTQISYSEREYEVASELGKRRLVFVASDNLRLPSSLVESDGLRDQQRAFRERVQRERIAGYFETPYELATKVVQAIHNVRATIEQAGRSRTRLLFPFVTNQLGYDTGIAITNASANGLCGVPPQAGICTIDFFGQLLGDMALRNPQSRFLWTQRSSIIWPGEQLTFTLSAGAEKRWLITDAAGFSGYLVVDCEFGAAYGCASISKEGGETTSLYLAERRA